MKDNLAWIPHDSDMGTHPKCEALIATYGFEGYGQFHRLNELICEAKGCRLDLTRRVYFAQVAGKLSMSPAELRDFLTFLADPEACGLLQADGDVYTTRRAQEQLARARITRAAARDRKRGHQATDNGGSHELDESSHEPSGTSERFTRTTPQSKAKQSREEAAAGASFHDWLKMWAQDNQSIRSPAAFIRKVLADPQAYPDLLEAFQQDQARPSPETRSRTPPPARCDICDAPMLDNAEGTAQCQNPSCRRTWELVAGAWQPDPETGQTADFHADVDYAASQ